MTAFNKFLFTFFSSRFVYIYLSFSFGCVFQGKVQYDQFSPLFISFLSFLPLFYSSLLIFFHFLHLQTLTIPIILELQLDENNNNNFNSTLNDMNWQHKREWEWSAQQFVYKLIQYVNITSWTGGTLWRVQIEAVNGKSVQIDSVTNLLLRFFSVPLNFGVL